MNFEFARAFTISSFSSERNQRPRIDMYVFNKLKSIIFNSKKKTKKVFTFFHTSTREMFL